MLLSGTVSCSYHPSNGSVGLKIDTASFDAVPHCLAEFLQNSMKEFVENAIQIRAEESFDPHLPPKTPIGLRISKTPFSKIIHRLVEFQQN